MFAHCLQTCLLLSVGFFHFVLFFKSACSVPLSSCVSVLLLAALTEALSMFLQALS